MQISPKHLVIIKNTILNYLPDAQVTLFGSRITGEARDGSDVDVAIDNQIKIPLHILTMIQDDFAESSIPYLVDVVDVHRISEDFKSVIGRSGKSII